MNNNKMNKSAAEPLAGDGLRSMTEEAFESFLLAHHFTIDRIMRARDVYHRCCVWRTTYPHIYGFMLLQACELASKGAEVTARYLIETVNAKDFAAVEGSKAPYVRVNHDFATILIRWMCAEVPELAEHVTMQNKTIYNYLCPHYGYRKGGING